MVPSLWGTRVSEVSFFILVRRHGLDVMLDTCGATGLRRSTSPYTIGVSTTSQSLVDAAPTPAGHPEDGSTIRLT